MAGNYCTTRWEPVYQDGQLVGLNEHRYYLKSQAAPASPRLVTHSASDVTQAAAFIRAEAARATPRPTFVQNDYAGVPAPPNTLEAAVQLQIERGLRSPAGSRGPDARTRCTLCGKRSLAAVDEGGRCSECQQPHRRVVPQAAVRSQSSDEYTNVPPPPDTLRLAVEMQRARGDRP